MRRARDGEDARMNHSHAVDHPVDEEEVFTKVFTTLRR